MPFTIGHKINLGRKFDKAFGEQISLRMKGKKRSLESIRKQSHTMKKLGIKPPSRKGVVGDVWPQWKGEKVKYAGLHGWVIKFLGSSPKCSDCGVEGKKNGTRWSIHWANKSHQYKRDLRDWLPLCAKCHKRYDSLYAF